MFSFGFQGEPGCDEVLKTPESCLGPVRANQLGMDYWFKEDRSPGLVAGKGVEGEIFSVPPQEQV